MKSVEDKIETLNISSNIINKLKKFNINYIKEIWKLTRKDLKNIGFNDQEIKQIIISLQLEGLDLNKKIYD